MHVKIVGAACAAIAALTACGGGDRDAPAVSITTLDASETRAADNTWQVAASGRVEGTAWTLESRQVGDQICVRLTSEDKSVGENCTQIGMAKWGATMVIWGKLFESLGYGANMGVASPEMTRIELRLEDAGPVTVPIGRQAFVWFSTQPFVDGSYDSFAGDQVVEAKVPFLEGS